MRNIVCKVGLLLSSLLLFSCSNTQETALSYYAQSIKGHLALMNQRESIDTVLEEAQPELKKQLLLAQDIRRFASDTLGLPNNKSYSTYVELERRYVVWNVFAAESLALNIKQWCYLVIGCANYRGYYQEESAQRYADGLREQGYDVVVGGVSAYSTLGWFADPLTSALLRRNGANLAELIFHELAHQEVFIKNDSRFNEAFASVVGEQGVFLWLEQTQQLEALAAYERQHEVYADFLALVKGTRQRLLDNYQSALSDEQKLIQKAAIFSDMKERYEILKSEKWDGKAWYEGWFSRPLNNARFVSIATYRDLVPAFETLFERCGRDFKRFYARVERIGKTQDKDLDVSCDQV